ncbi:class I SAM-dependent methyltransferase [Amycolatopsis sp. WQ 127309]|uniref:class I SAM-dependent methyltransferase n=1 Tax=Amycolatopsis sp. WQ 127309 TaxID=2932773 RepID=UPI001FF25ECC|nr:class I SAM-dependent methyltransferase [Amycolatopsis sp. WQ 127309]UOZ05667.1 class I SAM-dependent methyltransferase [Amycolatopsis sp. WQ 127309]
MDFTDEELLRIRPERMASAYMEYRRSGYEFIYRAALDNGVLAELETPLTVAQFVSRHGVVPGKVAVAELLLEALNRCGAVRRVGDQPTRFGAVADYAPPRSIDDELIRLATGKSSYRELGYSGSFGRVVASLTQEERQALSGFDASNADLWDQGMQLPYYRYARMSAVHTLVSTGADLLDLASGTGLGLLELARHANGGSEGRFIGVEVSADFVRVSTERTADEPRTCVVQGNLEQPLVLPGARCFDGAMLVGAYHYLRDSTPMWRSMRRLVRAGGVVCLAMAYFRTGSYDQELVDLRYAQRNPVAHPRTRAQVIAEAGAEGFVLESEFWFGCFGWLAFRRTADQYVSDDMGKTS